MDSSSKYLPLKNFHVIQLNDLDPTEIKKSAKKAIIDREDIKHSSLLNAISKSLGFSGGFAGYQKSYSADLLPFLKKHNLNKRVDLFIPRNKGFANPLVNITPQQLSERCFYSNKPLPDRVYTGYNFNYEDTLSDGHYDFLQFTDAKNELSAMLQKYAFNSENDIRHRIKMAYKHSDEHFNCPDGIRDKEIYKKYFKRTILDIVIGSFINDLTFGFNLIGGTLTQPSDEYVMCAYYSNDFSNTEKSNDINLHKEKFKLFRHRLDQSSSGWVEIIKFNESLIFIKGQNGEYDFVYKDLKDKNFKHEYHDNALKISELPRCMDEYHFNRWHYFEYKGWREEDEHLAEQQFYDLDGRAESYPRVKLLKAYYVKTGKYPNKRLTSNKSLPGFHKTIISGKSLMISDLVSIDDFSIFASDEVDYLERRIGDSLVSVNCELDTSLPVTLNWYDALTYLNWYENKYDVPVRMLTMDEYKEIRNQLNVEVYDDINKNRTSDIVFINSNNEEYKGHPPHMDEDSFQKIRCKFKKTIKWSVHPDGMRFLLSNDFAEWLLDITCIRTKSLKDFFRYNTGFAYHAPLDSTGKYKGLKIGIRLCYEIDD